MYSERCYIKADRRQRSRNGIVEWRAINPRMTHSALSLLDKFQCALCDVPVWWKSDARKIGQKLIQRVFYIQNCAVAFCCCRSLVSKNVEFVFFVCSSGYRLYYFCSSFVCFFLSAALIHAWLCFVPRYSHKMNKKKRSCRLCCLFFKKLFQYGRSCYYDAFM